MVNEFGNKVLRTQSKGEVLDNQILREVNKQTRERFEKRSTEDHSKSVTRYNNSKR